MILKYIVGYPDYAVSDTGDVYSFKRNKKGYKLKATLNGNGYAQVHLYNNSGRIAKPLYRIYAEAFLPNPFNMPNVDHINIDKLDNSLSNLRWVSSKENMCNSNLKAKSIFSTSRPYRIKHPDGSEQVVTNLSAYARSVGVHPEYLNRVARGVRPHYKHIVVEAI